MRALIITSALLNQYEMEEEYAWKNNYLVLRQNNKIICIYHRVYAVWNILRSFSGLSLFQKYPSEI
jgi:hypothetical protein